MTSINVPSGKRLVWYLALEEYVAQQVPAGETYFFTWVVDPTVIFGRHQVMADEVNLPYCQANNIQTYRRKSGGGCVYADRGNLMLSYIAGSEHSEQIFQLYLDQVTQMLKDLGEEAAKSEHNDVLVGEHKVSGNACYKVGNATIVHGTMLYDVDFAQLEQAITPSVEKMAKHSVKSVRQRVCNLRPLISDRIPDIEALSQHIINSLCDKVINLSESDLKAVDDIEADYLRPEFIKRM